MVVARANLSCINKDAEDRWCIYEKLFERGYTCHQFDDIEEAKSFLLTGKRFCQDEGCPHHGTKHYCESTFDFTLIMLTNMKSTFTKLLKEEAYRKESAHIKKSIKSCVLLIKLLEEKGK